MNFATIIYTWAALYFENKAKKSLIKTYYNVLCRTLFHNPLIKIIFKEFE